MAGAGVERYCFTEGILYRLDDLFFAAERLSKLHCSHILECLVKDDYPERLVCFTVRGGVDREGVRHVRALRQRKEIRRYRSREARDRHIRGALMWTKRDKGHRLQHSYELRCLRLHQKERQDGRAAEKRHVG